MVCYGIFWSGQLIPNIYPGSRGNKNEMRQRKKSDELDRIRAHCCRRVHLLYTLLPKG